MRGLYLAVPPLSQTTATRRFTPRDDAYKDAAEDNSTPRQVDVSRFKGLGDDVGAQETTMDPAKRTLLRVVLADDEAPPTRERLMGAAEPGSPSSPTAEFASDDLLDVGPEDRAIIGALSPVGAEANYARFAAFPSGRFRTGCAFATAFRWNRV
jgi:hypothetical protein